jgi:hypothetical protein
MCGGERQFGGHKISEGVKNFRHEYEKELTVVKYNKANMLTAVKFLSIKHIHPKPTQSSPSCSKCTRSSSLSLSVELLIFYSHYLSLGWHLRYSHLSLSLF